MLLRSALLPIRVDVLLRCAGVGQVILLLLAAATARRSRIPSIVLCVFSGIFIASASSRAAHISARPRRTRRFLLFLHLPPSRFSLPLPVGSLNHSLGRHPISLTLFSPSFSLHS